MGEAGWIREKFVVLFGPRTFWLFLPNEEGRRRRLCKWRFEAVLRGFFGQRGTGRCGYKLAGLA